MENKVEVIASKSRYDFLAMLFMVIIVIVAFIMEFLKPGSGNFPMLFAILIAITSIKK